ncbi:hypothetical protein AGMMS50276_20080 [Synergistales bacterium]|nr:hypothetical protein AGMMS50276_20080 [Synergistales bacterium]
MRLTTEHVFDLFGQIEFYESLWDGVSCYEDYHWTKETVTRLKPFVDSIDKDWTLAHIDAVPDNFLFCPMQDDAEAVEEIRLIDWEYAGMQDPHIDIAMFAVYALYDKEQVDQLIDCYFQSERCSEITRLKIYAYIAACGLLWSNWCEYKRQFNVEFGEYALRQYCFAKKYSDIVLQTLNRSQRHALSRD